MTSREVIAEFILQKIQQNDIIEILTKDNPKPYIGYINDKDVFPELPIKLIVDNVIYNAGHQEIKKIRITLLEDENENRNINIHNLFSLMPLPSSEQREIPVGEIISITKKEA